MQYLQQSNQQFNAQASGQRSDRYYQDNNDGHSAGVERGRYNGQIEHRYNNGSGQGEQPRYNGGGHSVAKYSDPLSGHTMHIDGQHQLDSAGWNPRMSVSICPTKGLLNPAGENNCFVNSAVQVLWHLDVFRRSFRMLSGHSCMGKSCIFCALKVIFTQFQYSDQPALPPNALRKALAESFANQNKFQMGYMDDAAECFENILNRIHSHCAQNEKEDMCNAKHCIPHRKFALTIVEQSVCKCGATSEPMPSTQMVYYVPTSTIAWQARNFLNESGRSAEDLPPLFGRIVRSAVAEGDIRNCPSKCGEKIQLRRNLMNCPDVVTIGLNWDSERPTIEHTTEVNRCIGTTLKLSEVFHSVDGKVAHTVLDLVGVVCYYGKHYSTFFFHTKLSKWILFDDAAVRDIGPHFNKVVDKLCRGRYQPLLLLYARPNATPISVETALRQTVMVPGHEPYHNLEETYKNNVMRKPHRSHRDAYIPQKPQHLKDWQPKPENGVAVPELRRAITPSPASVHTEVYPPRRAITPNPDFHKPMHSDEESEVSKTSSGSNHARQSSYIIAIDGDEKVNLKKVTKDDLTAPPTSNPVSRPLSNRKLLNGDQRPYNVNDTGYANGNYYDPSSYKDNSRIYGKLPQNDLEIDGIDGPEQNGYQVGGSTRNQQRLEQYYSKDVSFGQDSYNGDSSIDGFSYQPDPIPNSKRNKSVSECGSSHSQNEDYNTYTLSNHDVYRRPSIPDSVTHTNPNNEIGTFPYRVDMGLAGKLPEAGRRDSKKAKAKIGADVVRYQAGLSNGPVSPPIQIPNRKPDLIENLPVDNCTDTLEFIEPLPLRRSVSVECGYGDNSSNRMDGTFGAANNGTVAQNQSIKTKRRPHSARQDPNYSGLATLPRKGRDKAKSHLTHHNTEDVDHATYISRQAVEMILNRQKMQRQMSLTTAGNLSSAGSRSSNASNSSLDSGSQFSGSVSGSDVINPSVTKAAAIGLKVDIPPDNVSRDSGYSGGDRNSASSASSTSAESPVTTTHPNNPFKLGSADGKGLSNGVIETGSHSPQGGHYRVDKPLSQIPENISTLNAPKATAFFKEKLRETSKQQQSHSTNKTSINPPSSKPVPMKTPVEKAVRNIERNEQDDVEVLCAKAEELYLESLEKEKENDLHMAMCLCTKSIGFTKQALKNVHANPRSLSHAQSKHNSYVMRSRGLHRKISLQRQESSTASETSNGYNDNTSLSSMSTDSDIVRLENTSRPATTSSIPVTSSATTESVATTQSKPPHQNIKHSTALKTVKQKPFVVYENRQTSHGKTVQFADQQTHLTASEGSTNANDPDYLPKRYQIPDPFKNSPVKPKDGAKNNERQSVPKYSNEKVDPGRSNTQQNIVKDSRQQNHVMKPQSSGNIQADHKQNQSNVPQDPIKKEISRSYSTPHAYSTSTAMYRHRPEESIDSMCSVSTSSTLKAGHSQEEVKADSKDLPTMAAIPSYPTMASLHTINQSTPENQTESQSEDTLQSHNDHKLNRGFQVKFDHVQNVYRIHYQDIVRNNTKQDSADTSSLTSQNKSDEFVIVPETPGSAPCSLSSTLDSYSLFNADLSLDGASIDPKSSVASRNSKSVTFADNITLIAEADEPLNTSGNIDFISYVTELQELTKRNQGDKIEVEKVCREQKVTEWLNEIKGSDVTQEVTSQDVDENASVLSASIENLDELGLTEEELCTLCRKRRVTESTYCQHCTAYMSRFLPH